MKHFNKKLLYHVVTGVALLTCLKLPRTASGATGDGQNYTSDQALDEKLHLLHKQWHINLNPPHSWQRLPGTSGYGPQPYNQQPPPATVAPPRRR